VTSSKRSTLSCQFLSVWSDHGGTAQETLVDLDGETVGRLPLDVSVLPRAFLVGTVSRR